jgi:thiol:disulfide interchange protein DsbC
MLKNKSFKFLLLIAVFLGTANVVFAADKEVEKKEITKKLQELFSNINELELTESSMPDVYQFWAGPNLNFVTYRNGHIMLGEVYDTNRRVSLADEAKSGRVKNILDSIDESKMIIYGPENPKRVVNVFTDIDCGYCRRLHSEVSLLNEAGIQVRYLAFPRGFGSQGKNNVSYKKYVSVWCSDDRKAAMTASKSGKIIPTKVCDTPIEETYQLGVELGLRGTPYIIYDDGSVEERGYLPAKQMIQKLGLSG